MLKRLHSRLSIVFFIVLLIGACSESTEESSKNAGKGDAEAQFKMAVRYLEGQGVTQNPSEAVKWYTRAAKQGHAVAQYHLSILYQSGHGVKKNDSKAFKWCAMAARQGYTRAQVKLSEMYENGDGVEQNYEEEFKWCALAAQKGDADGLYWLGFMYYKGKVVTYDIIKAYSYFKASLTFKHNKEFEKLFFIVRHNMTPQEIAEGERQFEILIKKIKREN